MAIYSKNLITVVHVNCFSEPIITSTTTEPREK